MKTYFFVPGVARPAGSKNAFAIKRNGIPTGQVVVADASKHGKGWRAEVRAAAIGAEDWRNNKMQGPLKLELLFIMGRPKAHFHVGKHHSSIRHTAPYFHTIKPDVTKLVRAIEDSLNGLVWNDDSQVAINVQKKIYQRTIDEQIGVHIRITELNNSRDRLEVSSTGDEQ